MSKTKLERIASIEEQIPQLKNQQRQLAQKHKADERKARTRRLIERGAILESVIPKAETLTNEQVQTLVREAFLTAPTPAKTATAQQEAATPAPAGAGGGARDGG
jgi:hypothetical protein